MWVSKIICRTCKIEHLTLQDKDLTTLILHSDVGILACHVNPPCSQSHELVVSYEAETEFALKGTKHTLEIECLKCVNTRRKWKLKLECEPWLVNTVAICFHASHEGHPFHLTYQDLDIQSP